MASGGANGNNAATNGGGVLRLRLQGVMTVADQMCSDGVQTLVDRLYSAYNDNSVGGILLEVNSGGGEATAGHILHNAIKDKNKPVVVHATTMGSAALLGTLSANEIVAAGDASRIGSIGSYISIDKKMLENYANNVVDIYATQSSEKNAEFRSLMNGDFAGLQKAVDKSAEMFQKEVRKFRKMKSDDNTLNGGMFYAKDAKNRGLVDSIGGLNYALKRLNSQINNW